MSNNENPTGNIGQVPVETYKCSQCNFYTNHEYYLQQHNLTHGLQALMDQYKRNNQPYESNTQSQPYAKSLDMPELVPLTSKTLQCVHCNFETDQEPFYKQHVLTHNTQYTVSNYNRCFESTDSEPHNISSDSFTSRVYISESGLVDKTSHDLSQSSHTFGSILIKRQDIGVTVLELFRCPISYCTFETHDENEFKQHNLTHDLQTPCPEQFRCLKCDFETNQEQHMKDHIKQHDATLEQKTEVYRCLKCDFETKLEQEMIGHLKQHDTLYEPISVLDEKPSNELPKEVYRCNNCDYETNLKAFLKRHMLVHTLKIEIKDEILEKYQCSKCSFETEHEKFLKRHELSHKPNKLFKCQRCSFETLYKVMFAQHVKAHEKKNQEKKISKSIKCGECSFETGSSELLDIHKKIKHSTKEADINLHRCDYCKYQTNWEPCLKRHIDREHPNAKKVKVKKEKEKKNDKVLVKTEEELPEPPKPDLFRCHNCDFSSKSKQYLILHLKRSHIKTEKPEKNKIKSEQKDKSLEKSTTKLYDCKYRHCTFQSSIKSNFVHHLRKHQSQNPQRIIFHICDLCDFIAKTEDNLAEHKKRIHLNHLRQVYKCSQCDFKTVFKYSLKTHSIKHKKYTCNICDEELESAYALVKHRRSHQVNPKNRIYLCDVCGFQSKNDRSLKMHKKTHNPEFKCPDCPFQTHSKVNFQNHCINHKSADEVTMFPCPHCSYQSRLKRNLAWHMKRHVDPSKAQIFKCPSCEYQTFTNAQLKSHLMVHKSKEEVIMLKCDFCTFETKRKSNMVQHRLRHLKDSPDVPLLSCPDCNYTTVAKRHLNKHRKTHNVNPDKMFQCTYCPYKIHRKVYLMRHMENHKTVETFGGNDQWQRYTFPPQPQIHITGVTVVPNLGQNLPQNIGHNLM